MPFTPQGLKANLANKPAWGPRAVASAISNDPQPTCEPQGWPRIILHNYRTAQIVQTPKQVLILYQFNRKWRNIWTDGRSNPKVDDFLEPRWWGYSVGRWMDDYTFVSETVGLDERTWLDNVGRPHSFEARIEERYVRRDAVHIDVTITIDDPCITPSRGSRSTGSRCGCSLTPSTSGKWSARRANSRATRRNSPSPRAGAPAK